MFLPSTKIPFIWSKASWAASGCSNSTNAKPFKWIKLEEGQGNWLGGGEIEQES